MIQDKANYRKPVSFSMYYIVLVKSHGIWCIDCGTWDDHEAKHVLHTAKNEHGSTKAMLITSPSDDERVISRIVSATNRFGVRRH